MKRRLAPWLFLTPYLSIFALFWIWPLIFSVGISFMNTRSADWIFDPGFNWHRLLGDRAFHTALYNTLLLMLVQVPLMLALATLMAVLLNSTMLRLKGVYRFAFFAPVVVGEVAYSAVFRLLFSTDFGPVNDLLSTLGFGRPDWLGSPTLAFWVIIVAVTWRWTGYNAIIIMAGLQGIDPTVYEAARLDGAGPVRQLLRITLPLLKPVLLFSLILSIIGTMQLFTEPALITLGGPGGTTTTLGYYLYVQGFKSFNFGYASTIAWVIFAISASLSLVRYKWQWRDQ